MAVGGPIPSLASLSGEILDGAWFTRAIENRDGLSAMEVAAQQLDSIIDFATAKSNISKYLEQALIRLRKPMMVPARTTKSSWQLQQCQNPCVKSWGSRDFSPGA